MTSSCGIRGYYPATLSCSQVHATNLNMKYRSTDARSSKQLRDLTKKIRYQDSSPSQVGLMTTNMTRPVRRQFYKYLLLYWSTQVHIYIHGSHAVLISGKSAYFETWASRPWKSPYFWIFSIEVREKSLFSIVVSKPGWSTSSCASWGFSKCCGNDVELFGNPSDPSTNHRWRVVWRHLVPATIPRASFIKFYYVVTESQSADIWCHVVAVRNLIGPQSRRYTWRTLCKTSSIFVEIRQHT